MGELTSYEIRTILLMFVSVSQLVTELVRMEIIMYHQIYKLEDQNLQGTSTKEDCIWC